MRLKNGIVASLAALLYVAPALGLADPADANAAAAAKPRFHAYVNGNYHQFRVGGYPGLTFIDRYKAHTRYTVCFHGPERRCISRTTGRAGQKSEIFTPAPYVTGDFTVLWSVKGLGTVARWWFHNGIGD
jgi:hypothetical protein